MKIPHNEDHEFLEFMSTLANEICREKSKVRFFWQQAEPFGQVDFSIGSFMMETIDQEGMGGTGIIGRWLEEIEQYLPGVAKRIETETGKIVFAGNGTSLVPDIVAQRYKLGHCSRPPVIVDTIDYRLLLDDLGKLEQEAEVRRLPFVFFREAFNIERLLALEAASHLAIVRYKIGSGVPPNALKGASLVVNCNGPPLSTLEEQLAMLAPGGALYFNLQSYKGETNANLQVPDGNYSVMPNHGVHERGYIITREK